MPEGPDVLSFSTYPPIIFNFNIFLNYILLCFGVYTIFKIARKNNTRYFSLFCTLFNELLCLTQICVRFFLKRVI